MPISSTASSRAHRRQVTFWRMRKREQIAEARVLRSLGGQRFMVAIHSKILFSCLFAADLNIKQLEDFAQSARESFLEDGWQDEPGPVARCQHCGGELPAGLQKYCRRECFVAAMAVRRKSAPVHQHAGCRAKVSPLTTHGR
jgi:hypothetical protein